jgi:hypothetical protein
MTEEKSLPSCISYVNHMPFVYFVYCFDSKATSAGQLCSLKFQQLTSVQETDSLFLFAIIEFKELLI